MAKIEKMGSGKYQIRFGYTDINGVYRRKSFTSKATQYKAAKKELENRQKEFLLHQEHFAKPENKTVSEVVNEYIDLLINVRSPSTIDGYRKIVKNPHFSSFVNTRLGFIKPQEYQKLINQYASTHKPRTVINVHSLFNRALMEKDMDIISKTKLPQDQRDEKIIPTHEEVAQLLEYVETPEGKRLELLIKFSVFLGLRISETMALTWSDIDLRSKTVSINKAMVKNEYKEYIVKPQTKYKASKRTLALPELLLAVLPEPGAPNERIIRDSKPALESKYKRDIAKLGFKFSLHSLRHYYASVLLAEGLPEKYIQDRLGHSTNSAITKVYEHTFRDRDAVFDKRVEDFFKEQIVKKD